MCLNLENPGLSVEVVVGGEGGWEGGYPSNLWKNPALGIIVNGLSVRAMHVKAELTCHNMYVYAFLIHHSHHRHASYPGNQPVMLSRRKGRKGGEGEWIRKGHS
jgi:hypothetical protein